MSTTVGLPQADMTALTEALARLNTRFETRLLVETAKPYPLISVIAALFPGEDVVVWLGYYSMYVSNGITCHYLTVVESLHKWNLCHLEHHLVHPMEFPFDTAWVARRGHVSIEERLANCTWPGRLVISLPKPESYGVCLIYDLIDKNPQLAAEAVVDARNSR